jgi:hypothetical protein
LEKVELGYSYRKRVFLFFMINSASDFFPQRRPVRRQQRKLNSCLPRLSYVHSHFILGFRTYPGHIRNLATRWEWRPGAGG